MAELVVFENELKHLRGRFRYNSSGFILVEFGEGRRNHFRLDLTRWEKGGYQILAGSSSEYKYAVKTIHLKQYLYTRDFEDDDSLTYWLYYYIAYQGQGIWKWSRDYVKEEEDRSGAFRHLTTQEGDQENGYSIIVDFLDDLGSVTGTSQKLSVA